MSLLLFSGFGAMARQEQQSLSVGSAPHHPMPFDDDQIDQYQTYADGALMIADSGAVFAQSFTPQLPTLTRVSLYLNREGYPDPLYLAIRDNLYGQNLTSMSIPYTYVPSDVFRWIDFDFPDLNVTPGGTYYIIVSSIEHAASHYWIGVGQNDRYPNGTVYACIWGHMWGPQDGYDFDFKTFGKDYPVSVNLSAGIGKVTATLVNHGAVSYNAEWKINVTGGILHKIDIRCAGSITDLSVGGSTRISTTSLVFGLGHIDIKITVALDNGMVIHKSASGKVTFVFISLQG